MGSSTATYGPDIFSEEAIRSPLPHYEAMRALGPVVFLEAQGVHAITRYAEARETLLRPDVFRSGRGVSLNETFNKGLAGNTLNADGDDHRQRRMVGSRPLLPGALDEVKEKIQRAASRLVDQLCERRDFDAVHDLAQHLPLNIVKELVGLPDDKQDQMLDWAAASFDLMGPDSDRVKPAWDKIKEMREFIGNPDTEKRLLPGGWAARLFRAGAEGLLPPGRAAELMRDYIVPSLDTTIAATSYGIKLFAEHHEQWERLCAQPALASNAVEEIIRLASPVRGFSRSLESDYVLGGTALKAGERVFIVFASANRDPLKFPDPNRFDITRAAHDHLGFGGGVHVCMGMHLARLEISSLLTALSQRVTQFKITGPLELAINNTIHAYKRMPVTIAIRAAGAAAGPSVQRDSHWIDVVVNARELVGEGIVSLKLKSSAGGALPSFEAGDHIDVQVRPGLVRQYSLCGDPAGAAEYRIGVLHDPKSRGGSAAVHERFELGSAIRISHPRNNFPLVEGASHSVLVAGGIGVTPLIAMALRLKALRSSFELHLCARNPSRAAFATELRSTIGDQVFFHFDEDGSDAALDLPKILRSRVSNWHLYLCGPGAFMDWVGASARACGLAAENIHKEHFQAEIDVEGDPFTVVAARSGITVRVEPGATILDALTKAGVSVLNSCRSGVCGTCIADIIDGAADHRDMVLTDEEKALGKKIAVCCSRSRTSVLTLDL